MAPSKEQRTQPAGVVVLGAGVVGLTTALQLVRDGIKNVEVWGKHIGCHKANTSYGAGALWSCPPFQIEDEHQATNLVLRSLIQFTYLSKQVPEAAVHIVPSLVVARSPLPYNEISRRLSSYRQGPELLKVFKSLLGGCYVDAELYDAPVADPLEYLPWLIRELRGHGVKIVEKTVSSLQEVARLAPAKVIVNCSGLGAKELVPDPNMYPVRGQVVRVYAPWINAVINDDNGAYIIPRAGGDVICGGTGDVGETDITVNEAITRDILARCTQMVPSLAKGKVVEAWVGLRPKRKGTVRIERETLSDGTIVVHNYGHGGAGYCMSWGSAEDASALVQLSIGSAKL